MKLYQKKNDIPFPQFLKGEGEYQFILLYEWIDISKRRIKENRS